MDVIKQCWDDVLQTVDLDQKVEKLYMLVESILDKHAPVVTRRVRADQQYPETPVIKKLHRAKDTAYRKGSPVWKSISQLLKIQLRKMVKQSSDNFINNNTNIKSWWKYIKDITTPKELLRLKITTSTASG